MTPPTIIIVHPREKRRKCTVEPLRGRPGFDFRTYPHIGPLPERGYIRLGLGGPELSPADAECGLVILDGTWRLAGKMEHDVSAMPVRTLPQFITAYPRTSKLFDDPLGGLATIEALYVACRILGRDTTGLLDAYHWRNEFLARNAERLANQRPVR